MIPLYYMAMLRHRQGTLSDGSILEAGLYCYVKVLGASQPSHWGTESASFVATDLALEVRPGDVRRHPVLVGCRCDVPHTSM